MVLVCLSLSIIVASDLVEAVLDYKSEGILESEEEHLALGDLRGMHLRLCRAGLPPQG